MKSRGKGKTVRTIVHRLRGSKRFVTQVGRSVQVFRAQPNNTYAVELQRPVKTFRPPRAWGKDWVWSLTNAGVVFTWTKSGTARTRTGR